MSSRVSYHIYRTSSFSRVSGTPSGEDDNVVDFSVGKDLQKFYNFLFPFRTKRLGEVETAIDEILSKIPESLKAKFEELLIAGDTSTLKDLKHPEREILGYFNEANKLKMLSIQMKEQDRYFIPMEESRRDFIATCTDFVNQMQAPETSAEVKDRCADLIQRAEKHCKEYITSEDPLNLKEGISVFSGLILNFEESFGKLEGLYKTFASEDLLKR